MNWTEARDMLRKWREDNVRKSQQVVNIWEETLKYKKHKLSDEYYLIVEQVFIASLDCNKMEIANDCLDQLLSQFPGSLRISHLRALLHEALERYDDALEILDNIIKRDETNAAPRKRRVAILKAKGKIPDAIKELTEYLKKFMIDQEAWQELCELYLMEQEYAKAAFCMEELILHNPHNHLFHQRFAEIKYTQGGYDNMELARSYYSQALKLNPNNMRALYGLFLASANIATAQKCAAQKKKEASNLSQWAHKQIIERYREKDAKSIQINILEGLMGSLQISSNVVAL